MTMNAATVLEIPDGENVSVQSINGKGEIGPDSDGTGVFLMVNGKLVIADGSQEAVKSYYSIMVNGKVLMPKSFEGRFSNIQVRGKTEYSVYRKSSEHSVLLLRKSLLPGYRD